MVIGFNIKKKSQNCEHMWWVLNLAVGRFPINVIKDSYDSKNKSLIHPRFHHHTIQIIVFHQFLHFLHHTHLLNISSISTFKQKMLLLCDIVSQLNKQINWLAYLCYLVPFRVNNATTLVREIATDLKITTSILGRDFDCLVLDQTRIGFSQVEN